MFIQNAHQMSILWLVGEGGEEFIVDGVFCFCPVNLNQLSFLVLFDYSAGLATICQTDNVEGKNVYFELIATSYTTKPN